MVVIIHSRDTPLYTAFFIRYCYLYCYLYCFWIGQKNCENTFSSVYCV